MCVRSPANVNTWLVELIVSAVVTHAVTATASARRVVGKKAAVGVLPSSRCAPTSTTSLLSIMMQIDVKSVPLKL